MGRGTKTRLISQAVVAVTVLYLYILFYTASNSSHRSRKLKRPAYHKAVQHTSYKESLPELLGQPGPHYVLFTSSTYEGLPWCPDCAVNVPIVRSILSQAGASLLEVEVGDPMDWADRGHPLRTDGLAPVQYIPTVYHWTPSGPGARISNQLNSDEEVETLRVAFAQFVKDTAGKSHTAVSFAQEVIESKGKKCGKC